MSINSSFWRGGGIFWFGGGGNADFILMGVRIFLKEKTLRLRELFRRVRVNFCLLPCETSQEPNKNCSEKLGQKNFLFWVDFLGLRGFVVLMNNFSGKCTQFHLTFVSLHQIFVNFEQLGLSLVSLVKCSQV